VSLEGVWPLSTSLDTIGPMARDVAGLVAGMQLLEPGFSVATSPARVVGRFRVEADPVIDAAVDAALAAAELEVVDIQLPGWQAAFGAGAALLIAEAYVADRHLDRSGISDEVAARLEMGASVDSAQVASAREAQVAWRAELARAFQRVEVVALPTLATTIPLLDDEEDLRPVAPALPVNFAGVPAIALPVPAGPLPASLQLIGPHHAEDLLLATGRIVEAAVS
jgi:amidase